MSDNLGEMSQGELVELMHRVADEIESRMIIHADQCVCCGAYVPEGRQICSACEKQMEEGVPDGTVVDDRDRRFFRRVRRHFAHGAVLRKRRGRPEKKVVGR